jgi:uncharacterized protein (TIGR00297 family)
VNSLQTVTAGLALATTIALAAKRTRSLSGSGAVAAALVGTMAVVAGWSWGIVLIAYFVSASMLSSFRAAEKAARSAGRIEKSGARDAAQVLANGGLFALAAVGHAASPDAIWQALGAGALAASAADTWATEIGRLSRAAPRSILEGSPVAVGTSGGVTLLGFAAAVTGAGSVALMTWLVGWPRIAIVAALIGGVVGCLLDSVIGASLQARRWCAKCDAITERRRHSCGSPTTVMGGIRWLDNDGVNAISTVGGALFGATVASYF